MQKQAVRKLTSKIFKLLYSGDLEIKLVLLRHYRLGEIEDTTIKISPLKRAPTDAAPPSPAYTLIHELRPRLSEAETIELSNAVWSELNADQKLALYEYLFE